MAIRLVGGKRRRQPQHAVAVDWSNPITRGLVFAFNGAHGYDVVAKQIATNNGGIVTRPGANGLGPDISGTQNYDFANCPDYNTTGEVSIVWGGVFDGTTGAYRCPITKADTNGATNSPFEIYVDTTSGKLVFLRANAGYKAHTLSTVLTAGAFTVFGIAAPTLIETAPAAWVNKTTQAITSGSTGTGAAIGNTKGINIGRRPDGGTQLDGTCSFAFVFNRKISEKEYLSLYENPWQVFEPRKQVLYLDVATSGVTGTISCILDGFTSSMVGTTTVLGTITKTTDNSVASMAGTTSVLGTISNTLGNDIGTLVGTTTVLGTITSTTGPDTASMSGTTSIVGTMTTNTGNAISEISGTTTVLGQITGVMVDFISAIYGSSGVEEIIAKLRTMIGVGK